MKCKIVILLMLIIISGIAVIKSSSEEIHISSSSILLTGRPGRVFNGNFTIYTDTGNLRSVGLEGQLKPWFLLEENKTINLRKWVRISPLSFELEPGESKIINYHITVPEEAVGYMMVMLTYQTKPIEPEEELEFEGEENQVDAEFQDFGPAVENNLPKEKEEKKKEKVMVYNLPVYLIIEGKTEINFKVKNLQIQNKEKKAVTSLELENQGNIFIRPNLMEIRIHDEYYNEIAVITLDHNKPLFNNSIYTYTGDGEILSLDQGEYVISALIKGDYPEFEFSKDIDLTVNAEGMYEIMLENEDIR